MTLWKCRLHKSIGEEEWSNVYTVNAASVAAATAVGQNIATMEKAVHCRNVNFGLMEVEPAILGAGGGTVVTIGGVGSLAFDADAALLFVTVRCTFRPSSGKPSMKYIRGALNNVQYSAATGILLGSLVTIFQNNYVAPLVALAAFVDVDGQAFTGGAVIPHIQERQLKRKRRSRPGQKRGWITA